MDYYKAVLNTTNYTLRHITDSSIPTLIHDSRNRSMLSVSASVASVASEAEARTTAKVRPKAVAKAAVKAEANAAAKAGAKAVVKVEAKAEERGVMMERAQ